MKKTIPTLLISLFYGAVLAQTYFNKSISTFYFLANKEITYTKSGDMIYLLSEDFEQVILSKIDLQGNIVWNKTIQIENSKINSIETTLLSTKDDGVIFGIKSIDKNQMPSLDIVKFDKNGNLLWKKTLSNTIYDRIKLFANQQDEIYAITTLMPEVCVIAKFDKNGNELLTKQVTLKDYYFEYAVLDQLNDRLIFCDENITVFNNQLEITEAYNTTIFLRDAMYLNNRLYFIGQQNLPPYRAQIICTDADDLTKVYWTKSSNKFDFNRGNFANDGKNIYLSYDYLNINNNLPPNGIIYKISENGDKIWTKQFDKCGDSQGIKLSIHKEKLLLAHSSLQQIDTSGGTDCYALDIKEDYFKKITKSITKRPIPTNKIEDYTLPPASGAITLTNYQYNLKDICFEKTLLLI